MCRSALCSPLLAPFGLESVTVWTRGRNGTDMRCNTYPFHCYTNPNFLYSTLSGQRPLTLSVSRCGTHFLTLSKVKKQIFDARC